MKLPPDPELMNDQYWDRPIGFIRKTVEGFTGHGMKQVLRKDPSLVMAEIAGQQIM